MYALGLVAQSEEGLVAMAAHNWISVRSQAVGRLMGVAVPEDYWSLFQVRSDGWRHHDVI
jgi:hypothetical protein